MTPSEGIAVRRALRNARLARAALDKVEVGHPELKLANLKLIEVSVLLEDALEKVSP